MAGESNDMDSLFEGMDFVMPLEISNDFPVSSQIPETKPLKGREVDRDGRTLTVPESTTVSIPPIISPSVDPITPLSQDAIGVSSRHSIALPSTLPQNSSESSLPTSSSPLSQGISSRNPTAPLDESLFSGLTILASGNDCTAEFKLQTPLSDTQTNSNSESITATHLPSIVHERSRSFDGADRIENGNKDGASMEGMVAPYNDTLPIFSGKYTSSGIPPISRPISGFAAPAMKPSMRRKRRSMKIGYGREEEENEELLLRNSAIREALGVVGGVPAREEIGSLSSSSTPAAELSRESSQSALFVEESILGLSLSKDLEVVNMQEPVPVTVDAGDSPNISVSQGTILEAHGTERAEVREILGEAAPVRDPLERSTLPNIAAMVQADIPIPEKPQDSLVADASAQNGELDVDRSAARTSSNDDTVLALAKDFEVTGRAESAEDKEVDLDETIDSDKTLDMGLESLAQQREGSIEERLEYVKEIIVKKREVLQSKSSAISDLRKAAVHKRRKAAENVGTASLKCKDLEAELEVACENEDFEKAESLTGCISEAEKNLAVASEALTKAEAESDSTTLALQEVLDLQMAVDEEGAKVYGLLQQEALDAAEKLLLQAQETSNRELERLAEGETTLEMKKADLAVEYKHVEEEEVILSKAIEDLTKSETEEKLILLDKKTKLDVELEDLKALVRAKESEIAECDKHIAAVDEKVGSVAATFQKEKTALDIRLKTLVTQSLQVEQDSSVLAMEKQGIAQDLADAEKESSRLQNFASIARNTGDALQLTLETKKAAALKTLQSREKRSGLDFMEKNAQAEVELLRQEASSMRNLLEDLTSSKAKLGQELVAVKDRISFVEKRGPELDSEKKLAAAARNFKVAGRIAAEAKVLSAEKHLASADLARIIKELDRVELEAEEKLSSLNTLDNLVKAKEAEAARARCERLRLVAAAARGERDVATELEDFEEAKILESEANAAEAEAEEIQRLYQFDEAECGNSDNLDVIDATADQCGREAAILEFEMLRLLAATARAERDAAVELDKFDEAEVFDTKAEKADEQADKLQRIYQLETRS